MSKPLVSLVISSFNRLEDLKECLRRSSDIHYPNLELIIVDAGSKDGSGEYLKSLDQEKYKVIFIEDKGIGYSRLTGIKAAKGEFVISIDEDAFLRPDVVEATVNIFSLNQRLGVIGYGFINPRIDFNEEQYRKRTEYHDIPQDCISGYDNIIALCGCALRKASLEGFGEQDLNWVDISRFNSPASSKRLLTTEIETDLCMHIFLNGYQAVNISELVVFHKSSPTNRSINPRIAIQIKACISSITKYYPWENMVFESARLIYYCLYHAVMQKNIVYISSLLFSLQHPAQELFSRKRLSRSTYRLMKRHPMQTIFSRSSDSVYAGGAGPTGKI